jgi:hypothetical protein
MVKAPQKNHTISPIGSERIFIHKSILQSYQEEFEAVTKKEKNDS